MTAAITLGDDLIITHVGDSRAYLHRGGSLTRLTRDHSLADRMMREGVKAPTDRLSRELRGILLQALGAQDTECKPEVNHFVLSDGDCLLLCTDGLTTQVDDSLIEEVLNRNLSAADACQVLIDLSLQKGGLDNVTALIGRYSIPSRGDSPLYYTGPKRTHH
jgi:protein phosphatase